MHKSQTNYAEITQITHKLREDDAEITQILRQQPVVKPNRKCCVYRV